MCVATVIHKATINATCFFFALIRLDKLKAIICACAIQSYYRLEKCRSETAMQMEQFLKRVWVWL